MLENKEAAATIAVKSVDTAGKFYGGKLGLKALPSNEKSVLTYEAGKSRVLVYESQFAGTNKATAATFVVGNDLDGIVKDLKTKGVAFEHYEMPGITREGDIHVGGNMRVAWFKDPDGNILSMVNG